MSSLVYFGLLTINCKLMQVILILFFCSMLLLFSCNRKKAIKQFSFDSKFTDSVSVESEPSALRLNLCTVIKEEWDSIVVVQPYTEPSKVKSLGLKNIQAIESNVERMAHIDFHTLLLFVKEDKVIGYSELPRDHFDIRELALHSTKGFPVIEKHVCD